MATNDSAAAKELDAYLREELHRITQRANERTAQVINEVIQRLRAESESIIAEITIDTGDC
ncbi:MAG: hypothetical protein JSW38_00960 [Dehalococcoidia bacterium]|nr:MAG: hypothetical protein JSV02_05290 [Dehalococcoidia bacterium]UCG83424.1 MAG: hypothetical protein JSW38_00960 [Dehalococcoidia bacterium]